MSNVENMSVVFAEAVPKEEQKLNIISLDFCSKCGITFSEIEDFMLLVKSEIICAKCYANLCINCTEVVCENGQELCEKCDLEFSKKL